MIGDFIKGRSIRRAGALLAVLLLTSYNALAGGKAQVPEHLREALAQRFDETRIERILNAIGTQERYADILLRLPGMVGTSVSWDENGDAIIKLYTDFSASAAGVPDQLDGVPLRIERTGKVFALNATCETRGNCDDTPTVSPSAAQPPNQRDWHPRPVPIGVSSGHTDVTAGTLGCRVSQGCHKFALSNAHVYANENAGVIGDTVLQPGPFDGGIDPDDSIGTLYDYVPIVMRTNALNRVDAAIVDTEPTLVGTATRTNGYGEPKATIVQPAVGMNVQKYGRSSAQTYGYIDSVNAMVNVTYNEGVARFVGQIIIRTDDGSDFSRAGDSGSLIVVDGGSNDRKPVGLLFASGTDITVANPIDEVLESLDVDIDGEL